MSRPPEWIIPSRRRPLNRSQGRPLLRPVLAALALGAALACGGGGGGDAPVAQAAQPGGGAPPAAPSGGGSPSAPAPVAPISSRGTPVGGGGAAPAAAGSIAWDLPAGWQEETPSSGMRMAQASIPGPGGPAQLVVFFFGPGGGGGGETNLDRWVGQMEVAPGTEPTRESFDAHGYRVTLLDVAGTLQPSGMGMGPSTPQPDSRMLAAVVEGPGGPWFFKATGPDTTLSPARDAFRAMLAGVRAAG
jgi:hypothetical protein